MGIAGVGALMVAGLAGGFLVHVLDEKALRHPAIASRLPQWMQMGRFGRSAVLSVLAIALGGALMFFGRKGKWLKVIGAGLALGGTVAGMSSWMRRRLTAGQGPGTGEGAQLGNVAQTQATYDAGYDRGFQAALEQMEVSGLVDAGDGQYGGLVDAGDGQYGNPEAMTPGYGGPGDFEEGYGAGVQYVEEDWADEDGEITEAELVMMAYGDDYGDPLMDSSAMTAMAL